MKNLRKFAICAILVISISVAQAQVGINNDGTNPDSSAMLDVKSTTKGFLAPRMTAAERIAILNPATGLLVYQTDLPSGYYYYDGTLWTIIGGGTTLWATTGSDINYTSGNVGVGTTTPLEKLQVNGMIRATSNGYDWNSGEGINIDYYPSNSIGRIQAMQNNSDTIQVTKLALNPGGGNVSIGTDYPDASAILDVESTTKGFLAPRMTAAERSAILNPATGLLVYQTDAPAGYFYFDGTLWTLIGGGTTQWATTGSDIYYNTGNVGIGTTTPWEKLHVNGSIRAAQYIAIADSVGYGSGAVHMDFNPPSLSGRIQAIAADEGLFAVPTYLALNPDGGNVGIGTLIPSDKLQVQGRIRSTGMGTTVSSGEGINIDYNPDQAVGRIQSMRNAYGTIQATNLTLNPEGGNVGIGTVTPKEKLQVNGNIRATSNAYDWHSEQGMNMDYNPTLLVGRLQAMGTSGNGTILSINPSGGNVGIGTNFPTATLDVNGTLASNFQGFSYYALVTFVFPTGWQNIIIPELDYNTFPGTSYNTLTGEFTAPISGYYRFSLTGYSNVVAMAPGDCYALGISINGILKSLGGGNYSSWPGSPMGSYCQVVHLDAGNIVKAQFYSLLGGTLGWYMPSGHQFYFQGEFVGK